jgi:hypothetical protein
MLRSSAIAKSAVTAVAVAAFVGFPCTVASAATTRRAEAISTDLTPESLAVNAKGDVFVSNRQADVVDEVTPLGEVSVVAGTGHLGRPKPGPATSSDLSNPTALAVDGAGDLYIADAGTNQVVEKVTPSGQLSIVAGDPALKAETVKPGPATESELYGVVGVAVDEEENLYVDDLLHGVVEKVTPAGLLSIAAGTTNVFGPPEPDGFKLRDGYLEPSFTPSSEFLFLPLAVAESHDDLYIADSGSHVVEKVEPSGNTEIVAGDGASGSPVEGPASASPLGDATGLAVDGKGNLYIADPVNNVVEKVSPEGQLSVVAGNGERGTATPGPATASELDGPLSVAVDAGGDLYIADEGNNVVEKVDGSGELSLFAGTGAGLPAPAPPKHTQCADQVLTGTYVNVTVTPGHECTLKGAHVEGSLLAKEATGVTVEESEIARNLTARGVAGIVAVSGSTIDGNLAISSTLGAVTVTGSTVAKNAKVAHNEGPVTVENNHVTGSLNAASNAGSPGSTIVLGNIAGGKVKCSEDPDLAASCNDGGSSG